MHKFYPRYSFLNVVVKRLSLSKTPQNALMWWLYQRGQQQFSCPFRFPASTRSGHHHSKRLSKGHWHRSRLRKVLGNSSSCNRTSVYKNLSGVCGADRKIRPRVTFWHHETLPSDANLNSDPEGRIFQSAPNNNDRFCIPFDLQRLILT